MKKVKELFDPKEFKWGGANLLMFVFMLLITLFVVYVPNNSKELGYMRSNFLTILAVLSVFGILFGVIGDRLPFFNKYIGGGTVLVFLMAAVFGTYKLVPEKLLEQINIFYGENPVNFLELFIPALIVGSVLSVDRKTLIKSIAGYIPLILIGVIGASLGGVLVGAIFGKSPMDVIMNYVLPIMGGGTGAGAIPMSEMWGAKTGQDPRNWFAFAISILTIANIIAIITGALLKSLGEKFPKLTGNGELVIEDNKDIVKDKEVSVKAELQDVAVALFFTGILFLFANVLSILWKKLNVGFDIHRLAFLVILVLCLNIGNIIPDRIKAGTKTMQTFFSKYTLLVLMAAVGFGTDVNEIIKALTLSNLMIAIAIVYGAVALIMLASKFMNFYPIEAAITAGLCMANRGGSGDIAVLGAADRMELISFAQISSRIGGGMMLILGSIIFGYFA